MGFAKMCDKYYDNKYDEYFGNEKYNIRDIKEDFLEIKVGNCAECANCIDCDILKRYSNNELDYKELKYECRMEWEYRIDSGLCEEYNEFEKDYLKEL